MLIIVKDCTICHQVEGQDYLDAGCGLQVPSSPEPALPGLGCQCCIPDWVPGLAEVHHHRGRQLPDLQEILPPLVWSQGQLSQRPHQLGHAAMLRHVPICKAHQPYSGGRQALIGGPCFA